MKLELTREGLLVDLANHHTTRATPVNFLVDKNRMTMHIKHQVHKSSNMNDKLKSSRKAYNSLITKYNSGGDYFIVYMHFLLK